MDFLRVVSDIWLELSNLDVGYVLDSIQGFGPLDIFTNKWTAAILAVIVLFLLLARALKTLSLLVGLMALWIAKYYFMPDSEEDVELTKLIAFAMTCLCVGVLWIYMFFVRGD